MPKGGDDDGGRGESLEITDAIIEPIDETNDMAANILSLPSEQEMQAHRDVPLLETTAKVDPTASKDGDLGRSDDDDRDDRTRDMDGPSNRSVASSKDEHEVPDATAREEDLSVREARESFAPERDDDGLGM